MSTFQAPVKVRDNRADSVGDVVLTQTFLINRDATLVQTSTIKLPAGAQIIAFFPDVLTAYDSATSATLSISTAAAGTQYVGSFNAKTAGRTIPTPSAAQALAMANITTNTTLYATVTSVGQPTVGQVRVTVQYVAPTAA